MAKKVLVLGELRDGAVRNVSFEAIAAGKQIANGGEVIAVLIGDSVKSHCEELIHYGADRVIIIEDEKLEHYTSDGYSQAFLAVAEKEVPEGIVFGHTALGKDLSPKIASKLNTGLISDVTAIEDDGIEIIFTRPIFSGKAFEKKVVSDGIVFVTIRPNNIDSLQKDESRSGEVAEITVEIQDLRTIIQDVVRKASTGVDLSEAKIVIAGGRGVKSSEGLPRSRS